MEIVNIASNKILGYHFNANNVKLHFVIIAEICQNDYCF